MSTASTLNPADKASVNGIALYLDDEVLSTDELRQRACTELLRQAAVAQCLLPLDDLPSADGVLSEAASEAIEALLERQLRIPEPSLEACQRHHAAHRASYATGERVNVRHILFAVTEGVDVALLRQRAETTLLHVRCHDAQASDDIFTQAASTLSNCPSGAEGGQLGWLSASDCAPEFARELFGSKEVGVLPRLVHSRFGLHVVEVLERQAGQDQPFESVHGAVAMALRQNAYVTALRQYLGLLAADAVVTGVDLDTAASPLVQ
ncbi:peptidylprolyl isomerase [Rhodoferax sp.]|uniref:peptidylprolyl isomerase n=1 Tax=Rhodoferax sp. TaxID=50421 RepID=UPI0026202A9E|nr:peptidylprolyl isomerase [Rhodoferax sp.]MDD2924994.1 peptidylprolyl isomerase [Rhodoferax sp.]